MVRVFAGKFVWSSGRGVVCGVAMVSWQVSSRDTYNSSWTYAWSFRLCWLSRFVFSASPFIPVPFIALVALPFHPIAHGLVQFLSFLCGILLEKRSDFFFNFFEGSTLFFPPQKHQEDMYFMKPEIKKKNNQMRSNRPR